METTVNGNAIFPQGGKAPADYFTGAVWVNSLVSQDETGSFTVSDVIFEPGSRTNWHTHPAGQILLVTEGKGWYQEKGQLARPLAKGAIVNIPSGVEHWHGATRDSRFTHIAISNLKENVPATWLNPVTDEEYDSVHR